MSYTGRLYLVLSSYIKCYQNDDISPAKWARLWSCLSVIADTCLNFGSFIISLEQVKLGASNVVCRLILTSTGVCMIGYSQRGYVCGSCW